MSKEQSSDPEGLKVLDTTREAVKRFEPWRNADGVPHMKEVSGGAWVRWVDYCALLAAKEAAEASATAAWENAKERRSQVYEMRARAEAAEGKDED